LKHATRAEIEDWVILWAKYLGLHGWYIKVEYAQEDEANREGEQITMETTWARGFTSGTITVYPRVFRNSRARTWQTTGHEILHLVFAPVDDEMDRLFGDGEVDKTFQRAMERTIDRLSGCLTGGWPVPE